MNRLEQWTIAKAVTRYLTDVQNKDIFKNRFLPLINDFGGKSTKSILLDIRDLLVDWINEINIYMKDKKWV